jgi:hypothetical protein
MFLKVFPETMQEEGLKPAPNVGDTARQARGPDRTQRGRRAVLTYMPRLDSS